MSILSREMLHTKKRRDEICEHLMAALGDYCITCEIQLAGPEYESLQGFSPLPPAITKELFNYELSDDEAPDRTLSPDMKAFEKANVTVDNSLSPAHTLLQIQCVDQKGLFYDILRISKDCNIKVLSHKLIPVPFDWRRLNIGGLHANHLGVE